MRGALLEREPDTGGGSVDDRDRSSVTLWPNMRTVSGLVGVDPGMLSRHGDRLDGRHLDIVPCGQERRYSPSAVLAIADHYKRRPITTVAAALVTHATPRAVDDDELEALELDIQRYLDETRAAARAARTSTWLEEAERLLTPEVFERVRALVAASGSPRAEAIRQ